MTVWITKKLEILQEMNTRPPDLPSTLYRNLYEGQEATVRTGHGITDWFQIGKVVHQGCILSPWLFNWFAEYIMRNAWLDETQAGIKIAGRNINNLRYADDTTLMAENKEELKSLLMKVKEESKKVGLKLNIQKIKLMASGPITSWQIDGETMETLFIFFILYFLGLQSHFGRWLQPRNEKMLAPWKKSYDKPRQHIKKKRQYFANKGPSNQSYRFSNSHVCMWELDHKESWALKNWLLNSVAGSFPVSQLFASGGQFLKLQLQHQSFPWIFRVDFL